MAFPTTGLLDALTGTNGDDLNVYSASWASPPTGANSLEIQGNAATATVDLAYAANMWATTYGPDVEIYVPIDTLPATGVPIMLLARCQQETSMATVDGYALYYQPGSLRISRVDNGALTDLATAAITLAAGDLIGLEIIGSTLKAYRFTSSWTEVLSTTDTTYSAAGKIGLYSYGNTVRIGALYGGTVVASTVLTPTTGHATFTGYVPTITGPSAPPVFDSAIFDSVVFDTGAATGATLTPGTGHVTLTGYAPTVTRTAHQTLTPGTGHAVIVGYVPTVTQSATTTLTPATGHVTFTGYAPTVSQSDHRTVAPNTGHATLTGYAPGVTQSAGNSVAPTTGHATFVGYTPTVAQSDHRTVAPSTGHATLAGYSPTVAQSDHHTVAPGTGHVVIGGYAPVLSQSDNHVLAPTAGSIRITGYVPTVAQSDNYTVAPSMGHAVFHGYVPLVSTGGAAWPDPADVAAGVQYGPTGTEYTGTKLGGGAFLRRR